MLIPADNLRKILRSKLKLLTRRERIALSEALQNQFGFPITVAVNYVTLRTPLDEANDFDLFLITSVVDKSLIKSYYTEKEIEFYSRQKIKEPEIKDVIKFDAVEIVEGEQWIGKITAKELYDFKESQIINYNENTQRTMQRMVDGENEYWTIYLNSAAVKSIMELYNQGLYIPSTITLNIMDDSVDVSYNPQAKILTIKNLKSFDILDGYHRYIALSKCIFLNENFDYPMEIRITRFEQDKANQFIHQEDQKTRMKKIDSNALDQYDYSNQIVRKLNESSVLSGQITKYDGIISSVILANCIKITNGKIAKKNINIVVKNIVNNIKEKLETITELDADLLTNKWSDRFIFAFILCCDLEGNELLEKTRMIAKSPLSEKMTKKNVTRIRSDLL